MTIPERQAANLQYPGDSFWLDSSATASSHHIPPEWRGKFVEITGVGADCYMRTDPTLKTISIANETTIGTSDDDDDGLVTSHATAVAGLDLDTAGEFNGVIDEAAISPPRRVTITFNNHADHEAGTAVVYGTNDVDETISESLSCANNGNETVTTTKVFKTVTRVTTPAAAGTGATVKVGVAKSFEATFLGTEPHVYVPSGGSKHMRIKEDDEWFNHIESAGSQHILIALATGDEN